MIVGVARPSILPSNPTAVSIINAGAERVIRITEQEFYDAMQAYFFDTHNIAEGAGAGPLAGLLKEKDEMAGKKVGLILTGGNADRAQFQKALCTDCSRWT